MSGALVTQFNFEYKSIKYIITKTIIVLARWYSFVLELPARKYLFDKDILRYIWKRNNDLKKNEKVETLKLRMRRRIRGARPVVVRGWNACTNIFKRRRKYLYVDVHVLQQKIKLLWHRTWKYLKSEEFLYVLPNYTVAMPVGGLLRIANEQGR